MADPFQLSASVDEGFTNATPGSGVASCGAGNPAASSGSNNSAPGGGGASVDFGSLAGTFAVELIKGAVVSAVIVEIIAALPVALAVGATILLAGYGAYAAGQLLKGWSGMTLTDKVGAVGGIVGGFLGGGLAGFARGAAGRVVGTPINGATRNVPFGF